MLKRADYPNGLANGHTHLVRWRARTTTRRTFSERATTSMTSLTGLAGASLAGAEAPTSTNLPSLAGVNPPAHAKHHQPPTTLPPEKLLQQQKSHHLPHLQPKHNKTGASHKGLPAAGEPRRNNTSESAKTPERAANQLLAFQTSGKMARPSTTLSRRFKTTPSSLAGAPTQAYPAPCCGRGEDAAINVTRTPPQFPTATTRTPGRSSDTSSSTRATTATSLNG